MTLTVVLQEPSEEVRLLLLRVLQFLWDRPSASVWGKSAIEDTADIVTYSLSDIFPVAKRQSCVLLQRLVAVCGDGVRLKFERLLRALTGNLIHQHSKTRQLALATVAPLILCGGSDLEKVCVVLFGGVPMEFPCGCLPDIHDYLLCFAFISAGSRCANAELGSATK